MPASHHQEGFKPQEVSTNLQSNDMKNSTVTQDFYLNPQKDQGQNHQSDALRNYLGTWKFEMLKHDIPVAETPKGLNNYSDPNAARLTNHALNEVARRLQRFEEK
jgi:hypothetical protein